MSFTHLHLHTEYSLLDGAIRIADLAPRLRQLGMNHCAITDHGVLYGIVDFYRALKKEGIHPIIGCEVYLAPRRMRDKTGGLDRDPFHLILLAENNEGYRNLIKLVSEAFIQGFYYRPRIDWALLQRHHSGLIALSACLGGQLPRTFLTHGYAELKEQALAYDQLFGRNNFFLELQDNGIREQNEVNQALIKLSGETGIPLVATNDCHYLNEEHARAHEVLLCMQTGKKMSDPDRMQMHSDAFYLKSAEEMRKAFVEVPEAIENTMRIAERCQFELQFGKLYLPEFVPEDGSDSFTYLREVARRGLAEKLLYKQSTKADEDYYERLDHELEIIRQMGYTDYFLIVWDFIRYAHENEIMVGPGRGSGGGSLVAYALKITNIDPLLYDLLFERFLNPDRVSMPDFDCDFCYVRRNEIIEYITRKYGEDHVSQVITFGTLAARACIRDVARALDVPYGDADRMAKMIPAQLNMTIEKAMERNPDLKEDYRENPQTREVIDLAKQFEGMPRHASTHAAGVVISGKPIDQIAPLARNDESIVVQFNKDIIEDVGLLKFDILGLRTLTVMQDTAEMVKQNHGVKIDFDQIAFDDQQVYKMLSDGLTAGVFQLESAGMTSFIKDMKPSRMEDIIAGVSMYRPGPMEQIPKYIRSIRDPNTISYDHPLLEPILSVTYGCIIYQEQVMQIVRDLAGFSMGQSDNVRRAMSKKKPEVLARYRDLFIHGGLDETGRTVDGAVKRGVPESVADKIFSDVMAFAGYAFNKSHAAGYAVLAYQTAWLKYYYPVEFMSAMLNSFLGNLDQAARYIRVCEAMGIRVLPPDINRSQVRFSTEGQAIRFALGAIKNVGEAAISQVIVEREKNGLYTSFGNFMQRMSDYDLNKKVIESLIRSSALDVFDVPRVQLMGVFEDFAQRLQRSKRQSMEGQLSLFDFSGQEEEKNPEPEYPTLPEFSVSQKLAMEKEMLGLYISGHPLDDYADAITRLVTAESHLFKPLEQTHEESLEDGNDNLPTSYGVEDRQSVVMAGLVVYKREITTRKDERMAFVTLEDCQGTYEMLVFPAIYEQVRFLLQEGEALLISGTISIREDEEPKLLAESVIVLERDLQNYPDGFIRQHHSSRRNNDSNGRANGQAKHLNERKQNGMAVRTEPKKMAQDYNAKVNPDDTDRQGPASAKQSYLTMCIRWDWPAEHPRTRVLLSFLDYFSGDTPVAVFQTTQQRWLTLDRVYTCDLTCLDLMIERLGEQRITFI